MKRVVQFLFVAGSICAVVDIFTSPQLRAYGLARFCAEGILVALSVLFGWRQLYANWRENRRWWNEHAKIDMRILWRKYNVLNKKIAAFNGSKAERKMRKKDPDLFRGTVRGAAADEIRLITDAHLDLTATNDEIVRAVLHRRLAEQAGVAPAPEWQQAMDEARKAQARLLEEQEREREEMRLRDPEAAALREERELMLDETRRRLRELRRNENARELEETRRRLRDSQPIENAGSGGPDVEPSAEEPTDLQAEIAAEKVEMEALTLLQTQLEEALQSMQSTKAS